MLDPTRLTLGQIEEFEAATGTTLSSLLQTITHLEAGQIPRASELIGLAMLAAFMEDRTITREEAAAVSLAELTDMFTPEEADPESPAPAPTE